MLYSVVPYNVKARNKNTTWTRVTSCERIYARAPARARKQPKMRQYGCHSNSVAPRRGCLTKTLVLNQAIAALRQSVGLPGQFVTVWKNQTKHKHTYTHNYCNPAAHERRGLISHVILPLLVIVHDCATCCSEVLLVIEVVCVSKGITVNRD